jgi:hypothetical protein
MEKEKELFTSAQEDKLKGILTLALTGRGKEVEDISKEIHETMFPLTEEQIRKVNETVEAFIYGGGVQEEMEVKERLQFGVNYIKQALS